MSQGNIFCGWQAPQTPHFIMTTLTLVATALTTVLNSNLAYFNETGLSAIAIVANFTSNKQLLNDHLVPYVVSKVT